MPAVLDLGALDGPVLAFGGPYGNLEATRAVLAEAGRLGIPAARLICTGDVCAYCADPQATVDLVRGAGIATVRGNCEESLAAEGDDCGCGFAEGSACDRLSRQWFAHARAHLDGAAKAWMRGLPRRVDFRLGGRRFGVVHGGARRINRFLFASAAEDELRAELAAAGTEAVIAGHCGIPFSRIVEGRLWLNAGVIGMPANDGTPRGWFSVLTPEAGAIRIDVRALDYDHAAAARKMRERGLPAGYAAALETGLWPSLDVLPPAERARTGEALGEGSVRWAGQPALRMT